MEQIVVVGAGFTGCTIARVLAEAGKQVTVLDRRDHVAGNAYDHNVMGICVHKFGPHIFHTKNDRVFEFLSQFTDWVPYQHKVKALLPNSKYVTFPPNRDTVAEVPADKLVDTFYRPYTELMWGRPLENVAPGILERVPIREDSEDRYFPQDKYQGLPKHGYTEMVCRMLDHPNIKVFLNLDIRQEDYDADSVEHMFYSGSIDEYFSYKAGALPYRSLKFDTRVVQNASGFIHPTSVVNFTHGKKTTRATEWKRFPNSYCPSNYTVITTEEPCDYLENNMERYYPVRDFESLKLLDTYKEIAKAEKHVTFVGRCGSFAYLDMDQAVNQGLVIAEKYLKK